MQGSALRKLHFVYFTRKSLVGFQKNRYFPGGKFHKIECSLKAAGNHPQNPILAGKNTSRAFQRLSRFGLKVPELREKWIFLSPAIDFLQIFLKTRFGHSVGQKNSRNKMWPKSAENRNFLIFP